ncbi:uncharacterized protein DDB_G0287625 [Teleopsis dalmanni]|uniref:uncharacterized protein DDB_G0287625 n=1 Tax=Teleopsis dalmanni TaxID=139649 RepID=UPI0018CCA384|nr:uncharacterized protein DDB_G0287625 [Teleopsis dalmanni]
MKSYNLIIWIVLLLQHLSVNIFAYASTAVSQPETSATQLNSNENSGLLGSLYRKSRQSRCVRCYEDRYGEDRGRYGSGYSSRSYDDRDRGSNWYYPSYDRYDSYYSNYRDRDDRYNPRSYYDRYESRGYDRYDDRRGSYDRGESRGESRGYYDRDRYGDTYRDRYYDRSRQGSSAYGYDRDYYDRYYSRYDYRNYRPWDETYRGQSGFDKSGRGYYFATDNKDRRYLPEEGQSTRCGVRVTNCPYDDTNPTKVSSQPINSNSQTNNGYLPINNNSNNSNNNGPTNSSPNQNGWTYMNENDKNTRSDRDRERDQQSSAYGGRPPRPLGGSYLFDRDNNVVSVAPSNDNTADNKDASTELGSKNTGSSVNQEHNDGMANRAGNKQ